MEDIEYMVNKNADIRNLARQKVIARKRERKLRKMQMCTVGLALSAIIFVILGSIGAVHCFLATPASVFSAMAACFAFGLYMEMVKRK